MDLYLEHSFTVMSKQYLESMGRTLLFISIISTIFLLSACRQEAPVQRATALPPTPTTETVPAQAASLPDPEQFVTIATDAPFPPFANFDEFGNVIGFDAELVEVLMGRLGREYEFVVTNYDGMLNSVASGEFDIAVSALTQPEPVPGVTYTIPYLEVGQVLVVLANEQEIVDYQNVPADAVIGIMDHSLAAQQAVEIVGVAEENVRLFDTISQALVALRDREVDGLILDHDDADYYTQTYHEQLRRVEGPGRDGWITHHSYVIGVDETQTELLQSINRAIAEARSDGAVERITRDWLVTVETVDMGESLIGTPADTVVVGVVGTLESIDPADAPDMIGWEVKRNTMSGLYTFDADDNLVPALASGPPEISADRLVYTFTLRSDLTFPDGAPLTAGDVKWSINRAALLGNWHVNAFLEDSNGDFIADTDAVEVAGPLTVRFSLQEPAAYFLNLLATPPYAVVSEQCYATNADPARTCNGIGPYEIVAWQTNEAMQLQVNPDWPGPGTPSSEQIRLRFYADPQRLQTAVDVGAVDIAWHGLPDETFDTLAGRPEMTIRNGPNTFKSYLVFRHDVQPWMQDAARQAIAYAVDREALAALFGGRRSPLYSPLPDSAAAHTPVEPARNLTRAQELLRLAGYGSASKLVIPIWFLNDGRYTPLEEAYAQELKRQLEETGLIEVQLNGAPWGTFSVQMSACEYPAFLLGWPPVGWPTRYPAGMGWLEYFVTNTDSLCSNYQSPRMDTLVEALRNADPLDRDEQLALYTEIQQLWAQEYPTLDLTQSNPRLLATEAVGELQFDRMGLLNYGSLTKELATPAPTPEPTPLP